MTAAEHALPPQASRRFLKQQHGRAAKRSKGKGRSSISSSSLIPVAALSTKATFQITLFAEEEQDGECNQQLRAFNVGVSQRCRLIHSLLQSSPLQDRPVEPRPEHLVYKWGTLMRSPTMRALGGQRQWWVHACLPNA